MLAVLLSSAEPSWRRHRARAGQPLRIRVNRREALGLEWADVEFGSAPRLHVRRHYYRGDLRQLKTHAGRRDLPLSPGLARALLAARPSHGRGPVFTTRDSRRLADRNVRRVLDGDRTLLPG